MATGADVLVSALEKSRPRRMGMPSVRKYEGVTPSNVLKGFVAASSRVWPSKT
jgi:hypothetical protein